MTKINEENPRPRHEQYLQGATQFLSWVGSRQFGYRRFREGLARPPKQIVSEMHETCNGLYSRIVVVYTVYWVLPTREPRSTVM
jgi:hypothetical protein